MARLVERPHRGVRDTWKTPTWVLERLGSFSMDPSGEVEGDGLTIPWQGCVFINPPYGPWTGKWMERFILHGDGVVLVAARTDTDWFHRIAHVDSDLFFFRGRLRFDDGNGRPMFPSVLIAVGHCRERLRHFKVGEGLLLSAKTLRVAGKGGVVTKPEFDAAIEQLCIQFGGSVTSGRRTVKHSLAVGGFDGDPHTWGMGADVVWDGGSPGGDLFHQALHSAGLQLIRERDHDHVQPVGWVNTPHTPEAA